MIQNMVGPTAPHVRNTGLDERGGVRVPSEDPDYEDDGVAWPAWVGRDREAILQPPKPEMHPAFAVAERLAELQLERS